MTKDSIKNDRYAVNPNNLGQNFPIYRTINKTLDFVRSYDPGTQLNYTSIRKAIQDGQLRAQKIGNRFLIDVNDVVNFFDLNVKITSDSDSNHPDE